MTAYDSSSKGITATVLGWGKHARATHSPANVPKIPDVTLSQLGYWTDNGAYYYFYGRPSTKAYVFTVHSRNTDGGDQSTLEGVSEVPPSGVLSSW